MSILLPSIYTPNTHTNIPNTHILTIHTLISLLYPYCIVFYNTLDTVGMLMKLGPSDTSIIYTKTNTKTHKNTGIGSCSNSGTNSNNNTNRQ